MKKGILYAEQIAYSSKETLKFSYDMAVKYKDTPGVYVECGVAAGAQIIAMAAGAPNKVIYAFDSFQGIPWPSNRDDQMPGIRRLTDGEINALPDPGKQVLETSGATSVSEADFWQHVYNAFGNSTDFRNIKVVSGWFEETVSKSDTGSIAILRLDGDLYNSTFVCLQNLYPKVIKGGIVIIDDWQLPGCRQAVEDYFNGLDVTEGFPIIKFISNIAYFYK